MHPGKRIRNFWGKLGDMRMERKLLLVFLVLITLPLTFIGYVSYRNYSESVEQTTIDYSTNMQTVV